MPMNEDDEKAVARAVRRWRQRRTKVIDSAVTFSWLRVLASITTYALLCSDVIRSGVGLRHLADFRSVEPDSVQIVGPWAYPVLQIHSNDSDATNVRVWSYELDTTSISWRAFATLYNATAFPDCIMYRSACANETFSRVTAFRMIDQLASLIATTHSPAMQDRAPTTVLVRCFANWYDRLHHHLLPEIFVPPLARTNQAVHFSSALLARVRHLDVCGFRAQRPLFCDDMWGNLSKTCVHGSQVCSVGHIAVDVRRRYAELRALHTGLDVDLTMLSSTEDAASNQGGLSRELYRRFDISTILRVRNCGHHNESTNRPTVDDCRTILVDDYRYEGALYSTNVVSYFPIVAILRVFAQAYFGVRILMLLVGCYVARRREERYQHVSVPVVLRAAVRTAAKLPCQGIVYGSPLPVLCYVLAHCIDAPEMYSIVGDKLNTPTGSATQFTFFEVSLITAIQMRNIWMLGLLLQTWGWARTRSSWSCGQGIVGLPEYCLSVLSSATIAAQYRLLSFRNTRTMDIVEITTPSRHPGILRATGGHRGNWNVLLDGVMIDVKCLSAVLRFAAVCSLLLWGFLTMYNGVAWQRVGFMAGRTFVPYSARTLWPVTAFSIYWSVDFFPRATVEHDRFIRTKSQAHLQYLWKKSVVATRQHIRVLPEPSTVRLLEIWPLDPDERLNFVQMQMENVHERRDDAHAFVALMNLFAMTDPWTFVSLRWIGKAVCYIRHKDTQHIACLPLATVEQDDVANVPWNDMEVLHVTSSKDMNWSDLLHCC